MASNVITGIEAASMVNKFTTRAVAHNPVPPAKLARIGGPVLASAPASHQRNPVRSR
jgi:hypothetical protein